MQKSPRPSARARTSSSPVSARPHSSRVTTREASVSSMNSARAAGPSSTVSSDVFEIVADGNADVLAEMIAFSGAQHMSELRSKKPEDYGRNLLHCAVANGQLKTLKVLLKHDVFDPNQVDSVYTRSTPLMEVVKIGGRLDLVDCLLAAGARLDVQDVNGDSALHWAAREVSAAFLRQVLCLARKHGRTVPQLLAALQLKNNSGENAADVGANDVARESIRRLVSGEEAPGLPAKKSNSTSLRPSQSSGGTSGGNKNGERNSYAATEGGGGGTPGQSGIPSSTGSRPSQSGSSPSRLRPSQAGGLGLEWANATANQRQPKASSKQGQHRWGSAAPLTTPQQSEAAGGITASTGMPAGVVLGALTTGGSTAVGETTSSSPGGKEGVAEGAQAAGAGRRPLLPPEQAISLPKVNGVAGTRAARSGGPQASEGTDSSRVRPSSSPTPSPSSSVLSESPGAS